MTPEEIKKLVGDLPWMSLEQGRVMTDFIHRHDIKNILELGFFHGVSTCYMAAAISAVQNGGIVTIDRETARSMAPNIEQLLDRVALRDKVRIFYEPRTYLWRLMKMLEEDPAPRFDLCFIDGCHFWETDGFAFLLADRLLRPGGWIIFDDLDWKISACPINKNAAWAMKMTEEERHTAQIRKVYELLVKTHPAYDQFRVELGWAYAHKISNSPAFGGAAGEVKKEIIVKTAPVPFEMIRRKINSAKPINE
jgi:predicted O-methyltransferase YrrM